MKNTFFIACLFFSGNLFSQNIEGEWLGEIYLKNKKGKYTLFFPIGIDLKYDSISKSYNGFSTTKSFASAIVECGVKGNYNTENEILTIVETVTINSNTTEKGSLPFSVLNRFYLSFNDSTKKKLTGSCECLMPEQDPLCSKKLKIELRRFSSN